MSQTSEELIIKVEKKSKRKAKQIRKEKEDADEETAKLIKVDAFLNSSGTKYIEPEYVNQEPKTWANWNILTKESHPWEIISNEFYSISSVNLEKGNRYSDETIGAYIALLKIYFGKIKIVSPLSYEWLVGWMDKDCKETLNELANKKYLNNILDFKEWLFPMNINNIHWILIYVDFKVKMIKVYDSLGDESDIKINLKMLKPIQYLFDCKNLLNSEIVKHDLLDWTIKFMKCPQQINGDDSGPFVWMNMKLVAKRSNLDYNFTDDIRKQIGNEIKNCELKIKGFKEAIAKYKLKIEEEKLKQTKVKYEQK